LAGGSSPFTRAKKQEKYMNKVIEFYHSVKKEMSKVSWPERKELLDSTTVTVVFSIMLSIFVFLMDRVYSGGLGFFYKLFN
jgi:preprotein translocase subunit SecE